MTLELIVYEELADMIEAQDDHVSAAIKAVDVLIEEMPASSERISRTLIDLRSALESNRDFYKVLGEYLRAAATNKEEK
jgi:hypothetical protein